ncbi:MAG: patatin-like phospholipase family protein [bacterium]
MSREAALVLSGGAAYGSAHLGVLEVLEEKDFRVAGIAGASVGALVGVLYAFGEDLGALQETARDLSWPEITSLTRPDMGLLSTTKLMSWVRKRIGEVDLADAPIPVAVVATDLTRGTPVVFTEGDAALAVAASCAVPGLFKPIRHEGLLLVDGGLVNNLPVRLAREMDVGPVVASDLLAPAEHPTPENIFDVVLRAVNLMVGMAPSSERDEADLLITPDTGPYSSADLSRAEELMAAGRKAARRALKEIGWSD